MCKHGLNVWLPYLKVLYAIPSAKDLFHFHYCAWNMSYSTLFCCQSNHLKKNCTLTTRLCIIFKNHRWEYSTVPVHVPSKQQWLVWLYPLHHLQPHRPGHPKERCERVSSLTLECTISLNIPADCNGILEMPLYLAFTQVPEWHPFRP
jgi:hypothetical protein